MTRFEAKNLLKDNLNIPTIPEVVQKVQALLNDPNSGTRELGELIAQDAPLSAKVLRIANSAYYGLSEPCVSTEQASSVLGMRVLRNVVTQAAVMNQFQHLKDFPGFDIDNLWRHAITTGQVCSTLAQRCNAPLDLSPDEFYVCGLLHDLGQIVMLDSLGEKYASLHQEAEFGGVPIHRVEDRALGFNHTDVGALVATRWGLPQPVIDAIQFHHGPREAVESNPVVSLVANANLLVNRVAKINEMAAELVFDEGTCTQLGLDQGQMGEIVQLTQDALTNAEV